jgi:hypothetical protein
VSTIETPGGPSWDGSLVIGFARSVDGYGTAGGAMTFSYVWRPMSRIYLKGGVSLTLQLEGLRPGPARAEDEWPDVLLRHGAEQAPKKSGIKKDCVAIGCVVARARNQRKLGTLKDQ